MLFSIIVPIYNAKNYIHKCIDSILSQNSKDYELLLVDDGSTDGCSSICDEYAENNHQIRVIHKENGGYGKASDGPLHAKRFCTASVTNGAVSPP